MIRPRRNGTMAGKRNFTLIGAVGIGWALGARLWSTTRVGTSYPPSGLRRQLRQCHGTHGLLFHDTTAIDLSGGVDEIWLIKSAGRGSPPHVRREQRTWTHTLTERPSNRRVAAGEGFLLKSLRVVTGCRVGKSGDRVRMLSSFRRAVVRHWSKGF